MIFLEALLLLMIDSVSNDISSLALALEGAPDLAEMLCLGNCRSSRWILVVLITFLVAALMSREGRLHVYEVMCTRYRRWLYVPLDVLDTLAEVLQLRHDDVLVNLVVLPCEVVRLRSGASVHGCFRHVELCRDVAAFHRSEMPEYLQVVLDDSVKVLLVDLLANVLVVYRNDVVPRVGEQ